MIIVILAYITFLDCNTAHILQCSKMWLVCVSGSCNLGWNTQLRVSYRWSTERVWSVWSIISESIWTFSFQFEPSKQLRCDFVCETCLRWSSWNFIQEEEIWAISLKVEGWEILLDSWTVSWSVWPVSWGVQQCLCFHSKPTQHQQTEYIMKTIHFIISSFL